MKEISRLLFLSIFLASCANAVTPAPNMTVTFTSLPTATPTEMPTAIPTPTENPLAGAPEGATGKNSKGEWIRKVTDETGKPHIYTWIELTSELSDWFEPHGEDVMLFRHEDDPYGASSMIPMDVYFQEGVSGPYIREAIRPGSTSTVSLTGVLSQQIGERFVLDRNKKLSADTWPEIRNQMENNSLNISFITPDGSHSFAPSKTKGYRVYFVDWNSADPVTNPNYWEFGSNWRLMTTGKNNEVIYIISSKKPLENVGKTEFAQMLFLGLARVINNADQSEEYFKLHQAGTNKMWSFADWAINQSLPTIDISSTP